MIKRMVYTSLVMWAYIALLSHVALPHHHHGEKPWFGLSSCHSDIAHEHSQQETPANSNHDGEPEDCPTLRKIRITQGPDFDFTAKWIPQPDGNTPWIFLLTGDGQLSFAVVWVYSGLGGYSPPDKAYATTTPLPCGLRAPPLA